MKNSLLITLAPSLLFSLIFFINLQAQIEIYPGPDVTANDMVEKIAGEGIQYSNVSFYGADIARGIFENGGTTNLGMASGIFLTNGSGFLIPGPNTSSSAGQNNGLTGPGPWWPTCFDPSILEFDVIPDADTIFVKYVFGSEEYNEWVGGTFADLFGIYISGPIPGGGSYNNSIFSFVPGTTSPVGINTINNDQNAEYFIDNIGGVTLQYDGFTTVLTAFIAVVPCEEYHLALFVADNGDGIYDTGVFIEENSLSSPGTAIDTEVMLMPEGVSENLVEGHVNAEVKFELPDASYSPYVLYWSFYGTADPYGFYSGGDFWEDVPDSIYFQAGLDSAVISIEPFADGLIEGQEELIFIIENTLGCIVSNDTMILVIDDYIDMYSSISPNTTICQGQEAEIGVELWGGWPPIDYWWEPGSFTNDTITVSPDETTTYTVTITDYFNEMVTDSVIITVSPDHLNEILTFSFKTANNPLLTGDVTGEIFEDSVYVAIPENISPENLVASFNISNCAEATISGVPQQSGLTPNDFTDPVMYEVMAQNGDVKEWTVVVDVVTRINQNGWDDILIYPRPASHQMTVSNAEGWDFILLTAMGKPVLKGAVSNQNHMINISHLEPGLYFLKFQKMDKVFVKRVVITR